MRSKWALGIVAMLTLSFLPLAFAAVTTSTTKSVSTTTPDLCGPQLCQTNTPKNNTFDPSKIAGYFGADIGSFNVKTAPDGFQWATAPQDSLTMGIPTVGGSPTLNSAVYYNSTHTAYKLAGPFGSLNVFFKQTQYSVKISIHASFSSPQTVCLPFSSPNPIVQQSKVIGNTSSSIKAGNEIFDWSDIPLALSPTFSLLQGLCMSLPTGVTNIDPIALDGHAYTLGARGATSVGATLSTTTTNDIIVAITCIAINAAATNGVVTSITDGLSLTWNHRWVNIALNDGSSQTETTDMWWAFSSGTLGNDIITSHITQGSPTGFPNVVVFGVSGANTGTPFDTNGGLPASNHASSGTTASVSISTTNPNDFIFGFTCNESAAWIAGSGYTTLQTTNGFVTAEYKIVTATQSGLSVAFTGNNGAWTIAADAIQQAGPALVQEKTCTFTAASSPTCQFTSSVTSGNIVYVIPSVSVAANTVSSVTDSGSNTYYFVVRQNSLSTVGNLEGWYSITTTGGTLTVTVNLGISLSGAIIINEVSGARNDEPLSSIGTGTGTSTSVTSYAMDANSLVIGGLNSGCLTACTVTAGTSYSLDDNAAVSTLFQASSEHIVQTGTSETTPFSISSSSGWNEISVAFAPSASAVSYTYTFTNTQTGSVNFKQNPGGSRLTFMTDVPTLRQLVGKAAAATVSLASTFAARITVSNIANAIISLTPSFLANCQSTTCIQHIVSGQVFGSFMLAAIVVGFMLIAIMVAKRR